MGCSITANAIAALRSCCILETNALLKTNFKLEKKLKNTTEPQHDAKLPVISRFFEWFIPIGFVAFLIWALYAVFGW